MTQRVFLGPRIKGACWAYVTALVVLLYSLPVVGSEPFVAFSLREAARQIGASGKPTPTLSEVVRLAGITRLAGMVYDAAAQDIILVGQADRRDQSLALDDFVVALRALVVHKQWPLVSIDETPDSNATRQQAVRFEGGIANTAFGKALYDADVLLKDLVLGQKVATIWGLKSYVTRSEEDVRKKGASGLSSVRFWYVTDDSRLTSRANVFALDELRIALRTQTQAAQPTPSSKSESGAQGDAGERFARDFSTGFDDLATAYRPIGRLRQLFGMTALARGVQSLQNPPNLDFWLTKYAVTPVETAREHPLITRSVNVQEAAKAIELKISGGVQLSTTVRRLKDGDVTALEEAVLKSRPAASALSWRVPLDGWRIAGYPDTESIRSSDKAPATTSAGTTVLRAIGPITSASTQEFVRTMPSATRPNPLPTFRQSSTLSPQIESSRVGGVMLSGEASVVQTGQAGNHADMFSLLAAGENATLNPETYRKFVTALWAVYYSDEDPGISIDPIAWGIDKQLVRYIGRVINTDLGRVMREADYTMKKWAVGTEHPAIAGFKDVDTLSGKKGITYADAFRRFWFVPEGMKFLASDKTLVFDSGRIRLRTEARLFGQRTKAVASDERFAKFFTDHYTEIATKYPVFGELFE